MITNLKRRSLQYALPFKSERRRPHAATQKKFRILPIQLFVLAQVGSIVWKKAPIFLTRWGHTDVVDFTMQPHIGDRNVASTLATLQKRGWVGFERVEKGFDVTFVPYRTEKGDFILWSDIYRQLDGS